MGLNTTSQIVKIKVAVGTNRYRLLATSDVTKLSGNMGFEFTNMLSFELKLSGKTFVKLSGNVSNDELTFERIMYTSRDMDVVITNKGAVELECILRMEDISADILQGEITTMTSPADTNTIVLTNGIMFFNEPITFYGNDKIDIDIDANDIALLSADQSFTGKQDFKLPIGLPTIDGSIPKYGMVAVFQENGVALRNPSSSSSAQKVGRPFFSLHKLVEDDILPLHGQTYDMDHYKELALIYPTGTLPDMRGRVPKGIIDGQVVGTHVGSDNSLVRAENLPKITLSGNITIKDIGGSSMVNMSPPMLPVVTGLKDVIATMQIPLNSGSHLPLDVQNKATLGEWYIIAKPNTLYYNEATHRTGETIYSKKTSYNPTEFPCVLQDGSQLTPELIAAYPQFVTINGGEKLHDACIYSNREHYGEFVATSEHVSAELFPRVYRIKSKLSISAGSNSVTLNTLADVSNIVSFTATTNKGTNIGSVEIVDNCLKFNYNHPNTELATHIFVTVKVLLNKIKPIPDSHIQQYAYAVLADFGMIANATHPTSRSTSMRSWEDPTQYLTTDVKEETLGIPKPSRLYQKEEMVAITEGKNLSLYQAQHNDAPWNGEVTESWKQLSVQTDPALAKLAEVVDIVNPKLSLYINNNGILEIGDTMQDSIPTVFELPAGENRINVTTYAYCLIDNFELYIPVSNPVMNLKVAIYAGDILLSESVDVEDYTINMQGVSAEHKNLVISHIIITKSTALKIHTNNLSGEQSLVFPNRKMLNFKADILIGNCAL